MIGTPNDPWNDPLFVCSLIREAATCIRTCMLWDSVRRMSEAGESASHERKLREAIKAFDTKLQVGVSSVDLEDEDLFA